MLSVSEAASRLGVSDARIRALISAGTLQATKVGRAWVVAESSVEQRIREGSHPGRPSATPKPFERRIPDADEAHRIYEEAKLVLAGCYDADFLKQAHSSEERAFWISTADFFLQQKQRQLVKDGVY